MAGGRASKRTEKLQIMLNEAEMSVIDDWRFAYRMPSRAAAIRELISRGLSATELPGPTGDRSTGAYGVVGATDADAPHS